MPHQLSRISLHVINSIIKKQLIVYRNKLFQRTLLITTCSIEIVTWHDVVSINHTGSCSMWSVNLRFQCASCNFVFMENFIDSIRISCIFLVFSLFLGCFPYCFFRLILCLSLRRYKVFIYIW